MLNPELLEVCAASKFHVYAIDTIQEALQLFTDSTVGEANAEGNYPAETLLNLAKARAQEFWKMANPRGRRD
jgi:hypothetical protein